jgi:outer membrane protein TolC
LLGTPLPSVGNASEAEKRVPRELSSPLTLSQCIDIALEQNQKRRISKLAVDTARYQYRQALSSYWPQASLDVAYNRQDEDVNFIFPESTVSYRVTLPPSMGGATLDGQTNVPEQNIAVMDQERLISSLNLTYPLFTGGLRSNSVKAAKSSVKAAGHALRRTELELVRDVRRIYYGAVLARRLADIGAEALIRLETTADLTERLYKEGSGKVTKLDYLKIATVLESARSIIESLKSNVELTKAALGNTMGVSWDLPLQLAETSIPFMALEIDTGKLVADTYRFNPDWKRLAAGLEAARALVEKERSAHCPKVALSGTLWRWEDDLNGEGLSTDENKEGWSVGVGLQMPIFTGFMSTNKILESQARLKKMESRQILLKEGLALQVRHAVIRMGRSQKIREASLKAAGRAQEYRDLAVRAYMNTLISTKEVLESQIVEALSRARLEAAQYEAAMARFDIDFIVGEEVQKMIEAVN